MYEGFSVRPNVVSAFWLRKGWGKQKNGKERGGEGRGGEEKETLAGKPHDSEESALPRAGVSRYLIGAAWSF